MMHRPSLCCCWFSWLSCLVDKKLPRGCVCCCMYVAWKRKAELPYCNVMSLGYLGNYYIITILIPYLCAKRSCAVLVKGI
ncbi:hypothetical protein QBC45DRAFT_422008 [Copromyces sp. CBS 386.78]|nr:hypothetical protein QBC45DRAFT_422008 [Copromyces sp. CBS 386.78]